MYLLNGQDKIARKFLNGIEFFMPFVDPDGDFNYWGRGHGQIFGHGAAIYALLAAANLTGDVKYRATDVFLIVDAAIGLLAVKGDPIIPFGHPFIKR